MLATDNEDSDSNAYAHSVSGGGSTTNTVSNACAAKDNSMLSHNFPRRSQHTQNVNISTSETANAISTTLVGNPAKRIPRQTMAKRTCERGHGERIEQAVVNEV
jgi:hypothetical protein